MGDIKVGIVEEKASSDESALPAITVKGNTTFADLLGWGLTKEEIEEVLGDEIGERAVTVRNYCLDKGMEFSTVKVKLQTMADNI